MRYEELSDGIRVAVEPGFSLSQSDPGAGKWVFTYRVRLRNEGEDPARLLYRFWRIHDSGGDDREVDGEGVVGQQPYLAPGDSHEYRSFCVLRSPAGFMEGHYTFQRPDGRTFRASIPRFPLAAPLPGRGRQPPDFVH